MNSKHFKSGLIVSVLLLSSCVSIPPAQQANYDGNVAYYSHQYETAASKYKKSLAAAEESGDKQYAAIAMFGLARTYAQLCQPENAESWFQKSISAREVLPDTQNAHLTQNLLEYGRYLVSKSRHSEAAKYYDRAMPVLEHVGMAGSDPIGYALVYDEYAEVLKSVGRVSEASSIAAQAISLRDSNSGKMPRFRPEPYPSCGKGDHM